jgi:sulfatase maturation enzyme AslB (radical SAM superfamily)
MMGNRLTPNDDNNRLGIVDAHLLTPQEMFDHPRMQELRHNLSNDIRDPACVVCWHQEDRGLDSFRQRSNFIEDHTCELNSIDITASNICNLRCRMCSPTASHQLMIDHQYFKNNNLLDKVDKTIHRWVVSDPLETTDSKQWDWLMDNTHQITTLKASGGEPFYDNKIIQLLERYVETGSAKNTKLIFHTNATQFNDKIIGLLSHFKTNKHAFSIDGVNKVYEYIRYPGTFNELETSVKKYIAELDNIDPIMNFTMVLTAHNILNIDEYLTWSKSISKAVSCKFAEVYSVNRGIAIKHLPLTILEEGKRQAKLHLIRHNGLVDNDIANLIKQIDDAIINNAENKEKVKSECELFDMSRNQSYRDFLHPMLVEWLDNE